MPGPFAHLLYGLGVGGILQHASTGRFSNRHCAILALNGFLGPDVGSFLEWLTSSTIPAVGDRMMSWVHDPVVYVLVVAPLMGALYVRIIASRRVCTLLGETPSASTDLAEDRPAIRLTYSQCFMLCAAGGLNHFFFDTIFEDDGRTPLFRRIIDTGWWKDVPPLSPFHVILVGTVTLTLFGGYFGITSLRPRRCHNNGIPSASEKSCLAVELLNNPSARLFVFLSAVSVVYGGLLAWGRVWSVPPYPLIGEEADLGVVPFYLVFSLLPMFLCLWSMSPPVI